MGQFTKGTGNLDFGWLVGQWNENRSKWKKNKKMLPICFGCYVAVDRFVIRFVDLKLWSFNLDDEETIKTEKIDRIKLKVIGRICLCLFLGKICLICCICPGTKLHLTIYNIFESIRIDESTEKFRVNTTTTKNNNEQVWKMSVISLSSSKSIKTNEI